MRLSLRRRQDLTWRTVEVEALWPAQLGTEQVGPTRGCEVSVVPRGPALTSRPHRDSLVIFQYIYLYIFLIFIYHLTVGNRNSLESFTFLLTKCFISDITWCNDETDYWLPVENTRWGGARDGPSLMSPLSPHHCSAPRQRGEGVTWHTSCRLQRQDTTEQDCGYQQAAPIQSPQHKQCYTGQVAEDRAEKWKLPPIYELFNFQMFQFKWNHQTKNYTGWPWIWIYAAYCFVE